MKTRLKRCAVAASIALTGAVSNGCTSSQTWKPATVSPASLGSATNSANALGIDLYRRLAAARGNVVLSPASISMALAMAAGGARGETAAAMSRTMHSSSDERASFDAFGNLARDVTLAGNARVSIANRIYAQAGFPFERSFVIRTGTTFGAPLAIADFENDGERARSQMNQFVEEQTAGSVKSLLPTPLSKETRLVLVNAIHFLGDWAVPFDAAFTNPSEFFIDGKTSTQVPMMFRAGTMRAAETEGVKAVELDYEGGRFALAIVLPNERDGLAALETKLDTLPSVMAALATRQVDLALPRFELRPAAPLDLKEALSALGMGVAFDRERADFENMAAPRTPGDRLSIGVVAHKAFIRVDERGTEAAAATAVEMARAAGPPPTPKFRLSVDHPFLFVLRDRQSGLVMFLGRVTDPRGGAG